MTIRELARLIGVSKSTVSMALRDDPSIPPATREKVKKAAKRHGYRRNPKLSEIMGGLAKRSPESKSPPIALLSVWESPRIWERGISSFLSRCYRGCLERASELGYDLEEFWMGQKGMTPRRMETILKSRGIEGVLIFSYRETPAMIDIGLSDFAAVVIGRALVQPRVYSVDIDHFHGFFSAWSEVMQRGYRRPALVLTVDLDQRTEHSWIAAFRYANSELKRSQRLPVLFADDLTAKELKAWMGKHKPDVLLVATGLINDLLREAGVSVPQDVGLVTLLRDQSSMECAGIDGCDERVGARAIDLLAEQLKSHRHGLPTTPETLLLDGVWKDGPELPWRK